MDDEKKRRGPGRPKIEPTADQRLEVVVRASCGMPEKWIAQFLHISVPTLKRHYSGELERGKLETIATQAAKVYYRGLRDDNCGQRASEFWLKCVGGWKETIKIEDTPQQVIINVLGEALVLL